MIARAAFLAPLATVVGLVALTTKNPGLAVIAAAVFALGALVGGRIRAGLGAQRVILLALAAAGFVLGASLAPDAPAVRDRITGLWCNLAMAAALPTLARALFASPESGSRLTFALGALTFCFAGQARVSPWYPPLSALFVGAALVALRAEDLGRPRFRAIPLRRWALGAAVLATSVGAVALAARTLPPLHAKAIERFMRAVRGAGTTGFDEQFSLGSLETMLSSEEVVARVYGPSPELLRGIAYNRYRHGRWTTRGGAGRVLRTRRGVMTGRDATTVELMAATAPVYFVPLRAGVLSTAEGTVRVDALGALWRTHGDSGLSVWYRPGPSRDLEPAPPGDDDTALPPNLAARLTPLAASWTAGARTDSDRVEAIVRALRSGYRYRLAVRRSSSADPVLDFLFTHRAGNCEYFSSSTALLARAAGIPARVVGGYRVGEFNALGRFHIVRERNAHAWVEIWDGSGAWVTVDPTPERAIPANLPHRSPWLRALADAVAAWLTALRRWLAALTATQLLVGAGVLLVLWQSWRLWRARREERGDHRTFVAEERPLPCLPRLDAQLARRGLGRRAGETLERHAARLSLDEGLDEDTRREVVGSLRAYAAARYGDGDVDDAAKRVDDAAKRLQRAVL